MPHGDRTSSSNRAPHLRLHYAGQTPAARRLCPHLKSHACLALHANKRAGRRARDPTAGCRGVCPHTLLPSSYFSFKKLAPGSGGRPEPGRRAHARSTPRRGRVPGTGPGPGPSPYRCPAGSCGPAGPSRAGPGQAEPGRGARTLAGRRRRPEVAAWPPRRLPEPAAASAGARLPGRDPPPPPAEPSRIPHATAAERLPTFRTTLWSRPLPRRATRRGS